MLWAAPIVARAALPELPILSEDTFTTGSWGSYRVMVPAESDVRFDIDSWIDGGIRAGAGVWLYTGDGSFVMQFIVVGAERKSYERHVKLPEGIDFSVHEQRGELDRFFLRGVWHFSAEAEYVVVVAQAADNISQSRLAIGGTDGVTVTNKRAGTRTFMYSDTDFDAPVNIRLQEPCSEEMFPLCASGGAIVDGSVDETIGHALFGWFTAYGQLASVMSWDGPDGENHPGSGSYAFDREAPGAYRFHIHATASRPLSGIALWGADVQLA